MPRDEFQRSKPYFTYSIRSKLEQIGLSTLAVQQLADGQPLSQPADRTRLAEIPAAAAGDRAFPIFHQALTTNDTIK